MSSFKREKRYAVIKYSQLTEAQLGFLKDCIYGEGIPTVECVVVESDWPEYESVWRMLEDRFNNAPVEGGKDEYDIMVRAMTNTLTISREQLEILLSGPPGEAYVAAKKELRALLAEPVVEGSNKCGRCGASTVEGCNYLGCYFLESGNGAPVVERQPTPWSYCPECGCKELHHEQGEHKQCANCYQEWYSDIDYSEVVRGNLEKLKSLSR